MLFIGWLIVALVVVGAINVYLRWFRRPRCLPATSAGLTSNWSGLGLTGRGSGESVKWVNAAVTWFCEQRHNTALIDAVLKALTDEAKKHVSAGDVHVRFDRVDHTSKSTFAFNNVSADTTDARSLTILADISASDVTLVVSSVKSTVTSLQAVPCDIALHQLTGTVQCQVVGDNVCIRFQSPPQLDFEVIPSDVVAADKNLIQKAVREAIKDCRLQLQLPPLGADLAHSPEILSSSTFSQSCAQPSSSSSSFATTNQNSAAGRERSLIVKIVKANGLANKDFETCDPYCMVSMDEPSQFNQTSVVKNTINPFFDEQFSFNINSNTRQLQFEVFDRSKSRGNDEFLGRASVPIEELRRMTSTRQVIPLMGRSNTSAVTSGSITAEFTFSTDSAAHRHVETNRSVTPEGTVITTTTTTTDRLTKDQQINYGDSPVMVAKSHTLSSHPPQNYHPDSRQRQDTTITELALRELEHQQKAGQPKSTTITLTGKPRTIQVPYDEGSPVLDASTASSNTKVKKKSSFKQALKKRFGRSKEKDRCQSRPTRYWRFHAIS
jgi:hypothetical protein